MPILVAAETTVETYDSLERIYYRKDAPLLGVRNLPGQLYPDHSDHHVNELVRALRGLGVTVHRADDVISVNDGLERLGLIDPVLVDETHLSRLIHRHRLVTWTTVAGRGGSHRRCSCNPSRGMNDATWAEHLAKILVETPTLTGRSHP